MKQQNRKIDYTKKGTYRKKSSINYFSKNICNIMNFFLDDKTAQSSSFHLFCFPFAQKQYDYTPLHYKVNPHYHCAR